MPSNAPRRPPAKKKPGRPRTQPIGAGVRVPLSNAERDAVAKAARRAGQTSRDFIRAAILGAARL